MIALSAIVHQNEAEFRVIAAQMWEEERSGNQHPARTTRLAVPPSSSASVHVHQALWKVLVNLSVDPFPQVAEHAQSVVDSINATFMVPPSPVVSTDKRASTVSLKRYEFFFLFCVQDAHPYYRKTTTEHGRQPSISSMVRFYFFCSGS